jgi:transcriptional regulator GlxA family with amidase domain
MDLTLCEIVRLLFSFFNGGSGKKTRLSPSQTRRLFRKHLRASPRQWLLRERLMHAQPLIILNEAPLARIAETCGFCDVYHFSREIKRSVGISPAAWRRSELGAGRRR